MRGLLKTPADPPAGYAGRACLVFKRKNKNKQSQLIVINKIQVCPQDGRSHLLTDDGSGGND